MEWARLQSTSAQDQKTVALDTLYLACEFLVAEVSQEGLTETDFLRQFQGDLSFKKGFCTVKERQADMTPIGGVQQRCVRSPWREM